MAESPIGAVLFDLDGTLADTAADLAAALNHLRAQESLPPLPFARLRPHASHGARGLLAEGLGVSPEDERFGPLRQAFLDLYEEALCVQTRLFEGAIEVLDALELRRLPWGIVTNKVQYLTLPLLEKLGLAQRPGCIVCGDTTAHPKPHPEPLLHAARALNVPAAQCVYVGDGERDMEAAQRAGMRGLVARYGYISDQERPETWPAMAQLWRISDLLQHLARE